MEEKPKKEKAKPVLNGINWLIVDRLTPLITLFEIKDAMSLLMLMDGRLGSMWARKPMTQRYSEIINHLFNGQEPDRKTLIEAQQHMTATINALGRVDGKDLQELLRRFEEARLQARVLENDEVSEQ